MSALFRHIAVCLPSIVPFEIIAVGLHDKERGLVRVTFLDAAIRIDLGVGASVSPDLIPARTVMEQQRVVVVRPDDDSPYHFHKQKMRENGAKISYHFPLSTSISRLGVLAMGSAGAGGQPVSDSTDSQPHAFRENAHFMRPSGHRRDAYFTENVNQLILFNF
jgi:hypothetical protein